MFGFTLIAHSIKETGKQHNIKINIKEDHEVQYWSRKWAISPLQLESAVKAARTTVARNVEQYLRQMGKIC